MDLTRRERRKREVHGRILAARGDTPAALEALERAVELAPDNANVLAHCGALLVEERTGRGEAYLRRALERDPNHALAHLNLGRVAARDGKFETAEEHIARAVELDPESSFNHYALARVHADRGDAQVIGACGVSG